MLVERSMSRSHRLNDNRSASYDRQDIAAEDGWLEGGKRRDTNLFRRYTGKRRYGPGTARKADVKPLTCIDFMIMKIAAHH